MAERVQKILSQWGVASRRRAEKMILAGRIQINGQTAKLGDKIDLEQDSLKVDGRTIAIAQRPQLVYLLLNKPTGVVTTCHDPRHRSTVIDLLSPNLKQGKGIHPVGRLDFASSGALILTNDGELTLGLTHPRYHLPKTYLVELDRSPSLQALAKWRKGIMLDGKKTLPAQIKQIDGNKIEIILTEGRNRQIRRVADKLSYKVEKLHRLAIGSLCLNSQLALGQYRHLNKTEINFLKKSFSKPSLKLAASRKAVYDQ